MAGFFFAILLLLQCGFALSAPAFSGDDASFAAIEHDADSSIFYGDFFHAYRDYSTLESQDKRDFDQRALEGYLKSLFVLGSAAGIQSECARLAGTSAKAAYLCGRHFVEIKGNEFAVKILKTIKRASPFYWPGHICLASAYIISNEPQLAIEALKPSDEAAFQKFDLEDEFHLTLARAYTAENKFDDALKNYQAIGGKSPFYIKTLEESAWVFFKMRRFESAQVLLDALIGHYESAQRLGNLDVPMFTYYRARYLKAYQALSEKRTEGAAGEFIELRNEYDKAMQKIRPTLDGKTVLETVRIRNLKWTDIQDFPQSLKNQLDFISQWIGADASKKFESEIYYQMALSREISRGGKYGGIFQSEAPGYLDKLKEIQARTWKEFAGSYDETLRRASRDMETIKIKAELGRLEIVWLKRAEGARSLDEVIDNYRQEAQAIDEFMER